MHDDSLFICSGVIDIRENDVMNALKTNGFTVVAECECDNWRAFAVRKEH